MNDWKNDCNASAPTSVVLRNSAAHRRSRKLFWATVMVLVFVFGIGLGMNIDTLQRFSNLSYQDALTILNKNVDHSDATAVDFRLFWDVWKSIKDRHVAQPVDEKKLFYSAIQGLVAGTEDPYSIFFPPDESKEFLDEINGNFSGIGAEIGIRNNHLTIIAPLAGSPAETAGIMAGDIILAIDDMDAQVLSLNEAVHRIRGAEGSTVVLIVQRESGGDPLTITVTRSVIHIESVKVENIEQDGKHLALITITNFNSDTAKKFQEATNAVVLSKPDGLIVDLRNNPGGFLDVSVEIASAFLPEGNVVVLEQGKDVGEKIYTASGIPQLQHIPTVVLVNRGSASASEILAGALQDYGQATLIGATTFGKGTVQDLQSFDDGSALKLTVARWLTPNSHLIDKVGITPDVSVERSAEDITADRDPQRDAAILFFTNPTTFAERFLDAEKPSSENDNNVK